MTIIFGSSSYNLIIKNEGFDPDTYFDGPLIDANGLCSNERCQQLGYCRLNKKRKQIKKLEFDINQLSFQF